ncbi:MAG: hypothetical protein ACFFAN_14995 [Promethearchaeota archaeon]
MNIFSLNWILIDTIIILLLIFVLISVRIFRNAYRWRFSLSNEALNQTWYKSSTIKFNKLNVIVKEWNIVRNTIFKSESSLKPTIIIIRTNNKNELLNILTEGLASYGFDIINIKLQIKPSSTSDIFDNNIQKETRDCISLILNFFKRNNSISSSNYFLINYDKSNISYNSILNDSNNIGMVLINPKLNSDNIRNFNQIYNKKDLKFPLYTIFSKKSNLIFANKNLKRLLKQFPEQNNSNLKLLILENTTKNFKYYETILLGFIINLLKI